jgi:RNA methyltransferase, TrmH family
MKPTIQSVHNATIKTVLKLRDAGVRRQKKQFLIDGVQEVSLAVANEFHIECVYYPESGSEAEENSLLAAGLPVSTLQPVSAAVMRKLAYGDRESSFVAVARYPSLELSHLKFTNPALILVLDGIEKPGNLGAAMRTAAAAGVHAVVLTNPVCDVFNPNAIRASRGTMFSLPIAVTTPAEFINLCQTIGVGINTARVDGSTSLWKSEFQGATAIVLGSEAHGLDQSWPSPPCRAFHIPMQDSTDSLNVSISAALALYEAVRQRQAMG